MPISRNSHVRDACFGGAGRDDVAAEQFQPLLISLLVRPLLLTAAYLPSRIIMAISL